MWKNICDGVRSALYHIVLITVTLLMAIRFAPLLIRKDPALRVAVPKIWTGIVLKLQRKILKLDHRVQREDGEKTGGAVYAVKHQSAWETLALWHILDNPVFVLKKELLSIPVFGWYLRHVDNIVINRSAAQKALSQMMDQGMKHLTAGRDIVIFPEGTRTRPGATPKYKPGIAAIYDMLGPTIYPVALNSGCFWGRNTFLRRSGTIDVHIMEAMPQGLTKREFMEELQSRIETRSNELMEQISNQK